MYIPFEEMPKNSRIWIYQADRKLSEEEVILVQTQLKAFLEQWAAHGADLKCSMRLLHNQFVIITVDEQFNGASGCSIDSSVHFVQELGSKLGINFFDRTKIAFQVDHEVFVISQTQLKEQIRDGIISEQTPTFNNLVSNIQDFENSWIVPANETWLGRYFNG
ncbi:hypothetical protein QQ008_27760 [Fulvivirgaceae bacterium BMA10]|uniref:ABC transporter ATPase n=1 Tax=Splendidivirga corallicola TaxID=3051826 RepID=A0ABT8KWQ2_9BACT|nr:hypothetical protein [Fulvivirgaceae bacterium BMA10]